jgi:hypothetical protein
MMLSLCGAADERLHPRRSTDPGSLASNLDIYVLHHVLNYKHRLISFAIQS